MQNITDALYTAWNFRHACKEFDPSFTINAEDFTTILEAGRLSPSSFGLEPWQFIVVQDKALREEMKPICWGAQGQLPTASHFVMMLARKRDAVSPTCSYVQQEIFRDTKELPEDVADMYTAKLGEFLTSDFGYGENERERFEWAARQCYIPLGNMMTTAALLGIDSCPIEGFQKENLENLLHEKGIMDKNTFGVAVMVAFGKRIKDPRPKTRRSADCVVRWI